MSLGKANGATQGRPGMTALGDVHKGRGTGGRRDGRIARGGVRGDEETPRGVVEKDGIMRDKTLRCSSTARLLAPRHALGIGCYVLGDEDRSVHREDAEGDEHDAGDVHLLSRGLGRHRLAVEEDDGHHAERGCVARQIVEGAFDGEVRSPSPSPSPSSFPSGRRGKQGAPDWRRSRRKRVRCIKAEMQHSPCRHTR